MKIVILATTSWNLYNSRLGLATALQARGHDVILLAPEDEFTPALIEAGLSWTNFPLEPRGKNIPRELISLAFLVRFYRTHRPDLVNHYTPKGVIYGSLAAKIAGIRNVFNTITGLGYVYSGNASQRLQHLVSILYRVSLGNTKVIFQNPDNFRHFVANRIVNQDNCRLILGSGIDMDRFAPVTTPDSSSPPVVMLPSRFVEEKGVRTLVEAARLLRARDNPTRIVLVGKPEPDQPTSIRNQELTDWVNQGLIEWWGWHDDMEKIYPLAQIVCLPTYYMEGIPKALIEAAACGLPLIATDVPGCREIVHHGENGFLVPVQDAPALADAIEKLAADSSLQQAMGARSREIATEAFSLSSILAEYFDFFGLN